MYMLSITGNLTIISLTLLDVCLKTPMYFFLQNFSILEISFTSACIPRYLYNIATDDRSITYTICVIQVFFTDIFGWRKKNVIDHFFCDASPILKISCSDTWLIEQLVIVCAVLTFILTLLCVILSYTYIIKSILRFPSMQQRKRAISTCSSHMIVVSITYGSCIFIYVKPSAKESVAINKGVAILMTAIAPMLNPFI
uniref:Olfactory receptor 6C74-like n=1 Tax=Castor canadensis TaxID=51338 RepID=A0A8B7TJ29_CASCN|nr:olfactory receptor 6C74-like [Castor canadensis]